MKGIVQGNKNRAFQTGFWDENFIARRLSYSHPKLVPGSENKDGVIQKFAPPLYPVAAATKRSAREL